MPTFTYRGYKATGQKVGGSLFEATRAAAEWRLDAWGVLGYAVFRSRTRYEKRRYASVGYGELAVFCREAVAAFATDLAGLEVLSVLARKQPNGQLRSALFEIGDFVAKGYTPSNAFSMYGHVFGDVFVRLIETAESRTDVISILEDMAAYYTQEAFTTQRVRRCLLYPALSGMMIWVALILAAGLGWVAITAFVVIAACVCLYIYTPAWRFWADMRLATLPVLATVIMFLCSLRLTRGLALLTRHNVPLPGIEVCIRPIARNRAVEEKIVNAIKRMLKGWEIPAVLEAVRYFAPFFPPVLSNALLQGEHNGNITVAMEQSYRLLDTQTKKILKRAVRWMALVLTLMIVPALWAALRRMA